MDLLEKLERLNCGEILENISTSELTTYKVGGCASYLAYPEDEKQLIKLIKFLNKNNIKWKIIGNGSNLLFNDNGYDGVLIKLSNFNEIIINNKVVKVGSGYSLMKLALKTAKVGLTGLEFASGIPGTIGGAVFMNAGAYNSDMSEIIKDIRVLTPDYEIIKITNKELDFSYRHSCLQDKGYICLEATLSLKQGRSEEIIELINSRKERRISSQPLEYPNAGSVFRNPCGDFAGRLIEEIGYKGKVVGGAMVSSKHANFIVNNGTAKACDIEFLINDIKSKVKEKYNIDLKCEQEFVD